MNTKKILIIAISIITVLSMTGFLTYQNKNRQAAKPKQIKTQQALVKIQI